jgi:adenylate cyclase
MSNPARAKTLASPWRARLFALGAALLAAFLLKALAPGLLDSIDERTGEWVWRLAANAESGEERRVVIVDINEESLARMGPWPWSRQRMAELLDKLSAHGAGPVAFDIAFPDARPGDAAFAAALQRHPAVLAQIFSLDAVTPAAGALQGALTNTACATPLPEAAGYIGNASALQATAGHISPRISPDGAIRKLPALVCYEGRAYPALGIATLLRAADAGGGLVLDQGSGILEPAWRLRHPVLPGSGIPLDERGDVRLSYLLPRQAFIAVSAADVLEDRAPAHLLRGAWVLVGATAFGLGDVVPTPHGGAVGGVEVHAQFISALLDDRLPYRPNGATLFGLLLALAGGGLCLLVAAGARWPSAESDGRRRHLPRLPVWALPLVALGFAMVVLAVHAVLLVGNNLWLGWAWPASFVILTGIFLAAVEHARTRFERERLYGNLSAYLPAPVAREIAFNEVSGAIEAERREISVLFVDIRNFSAYCEGRPPDETAALLQAFFTTVARIVKAHGGVVEEYVGDAVMAIWNAPVACPDHPVRAFAAANALVEECGQLFPEVPPPGLEPLAVGVGLEVGDALVGSFGPADRRTHAALGETVTIASRLTAMTGDLAHPLLVGEKAAEKLLAFADSRNLPRLVSLGSFLLEGLRRPRQVFGISQEAEATATVIPLRTLHG